MEKPGIILWSLIAPASAGYAKKILQKDPIAAPRAAVRYLYSLLLLCAYFS